MTDKKADSSVPVLRKAKYVRGKNLVFRDATAMDAAFIHSLRTDSHKALHLSETPPEISHQIAWLDLYKSRNDQVYFIIEDDSGDKLGTVRLYDAKGDSFCWGSWILKDGAPKNAAIESALMVYSYAVDYLGFRNAHFDVRKGNESVWRFHERFGAVRTCTSDDSYLYEIDLDAIKQARYRYKKYLDAQLTVEF